MISLRQATLEDADGALVVVQDACDRLTEKGLKQWPQEFPRRFLEMCISRGEVYAHCHGDSIIALCRLLWSDPETWGADDGLAGHIHTLAVHRQASGRGLGSAILRWAEGEVIRRERKLLRLDCVSHNPVLRAYYLGAGFEIVSEKQVGNVLVTLFEKKVPSRSPQRTRPPGG